MKHAAITRSWSSFVVESVGDLSNKEIAERIGVSDSTVGNWRRGENFAQPDANKVIDFAREFGRPLPVALAAAGYGEEREYQETVLVRPDFSKMSVDQMVEAMESMFTEYRKRRAQAHPKGRPGSAGDSKRKRSRLAADPDVPPM